MTDVRITGLTGKEINKKQFKMRVDDYFVKPVRKAKDKLLR